MTDIQTKPHYLDLLNDITSGERRAGVLLQAWADKTTDAGLKECLTFVANRETSHFRIFKRRIEELGYQREDNDDPAYHERLVINCSDIPDVEKIRFSAAKQRQRQGPPIRDRYEAAMADETVDPLTRSLLRWFSEVEADSGSKLRPAYDRVEAAAS